MRFGVRETIFMIVLLMVPVASYFYVFQPRNPDPSALQVVAEGTQCIPDLSGPALSDHPDTLELLHLVAPLMVTQT